MGRSEKKTRSIQFRDSADLTSADLPVDLQIKAALNFLISEEKENGASVGLISSSCTNRQGGRMGL
jgi:hypothetical protein